MSLYQLFLLLCISITLITSYNNDDCHNNSHGNNSLKNITRGSIIVWDSAICVGDCAILLNNSSIQNNVRIAYNLNVKYFIQSNNSATLTWELYCKSQPTNCSDSDINVIQLEGVRLNLTKNNWSEKIIIENDVGLLLESLSFNDVANLVKKSGIDAGYSYFLFVKVEQESINTTECLDPKVWTIKSNKCNGTKLGNEFYLCDEETVFKDQLAYMFYLDSFEKEKSIHIYVQNRCKGSNIVFMYEYGVGNQPDTPTTKDVTNIDIVFNTFIFIIIGCMICSIVGALIYYLCQNYKKNNTLESPDNKTGDSKFGDLDSDSDFDIKLDS